MYKIIFLIVFVCLLFIISYYFISSISKKMKINVNINTELEKYILLTNLKTKIKVLENTKPCYDMDEDVIEINTGNNVKSLSEAFHEFGHAFFNHYNSYKIYNDKNEPIKYVYNEIEFNYFLANLTRIFFTNSIVLALVFSLFGIFLEINILCIVGIVFSLISLILHTINLWEEIKATTIAKEIFRHEQYLNKKEYIVSNICLYSALFTYLFITLFSSLLLSSNIIFLFK